MIEKYHCGITYRDTLNVDTSPSEDGDGLIVTVTMTVGGETTPVCVALDEASTRKLRKQLKRALS